MTTTNLRTDTMKATLERERLRNIRRVNRFRAVGVSGFWLLTLVFGYVLEHEAWKFDLWLFTTYALMAVGIDVLALRSDRLARMLSIVSGLLDMPVVFFLQLSALEASPSASGVAGFTVGLYAFCVVLASWTLSGWQLWLTTAVAIVFEVLLQRTAEVGVGAWFASGLLLCIIGAVLNEIGRRHRTLLMDATEELFERHRLTELLSRTERVASLGVLATGLGNELGSPAAYIRSNLDYISDWLEEDEARGNDDVRAALTEAQAGIARVNGLVRDLKSFSVESSALAPVNMSRVVQSAINLCSSELKSRAELIAHLEDAPLAFATQSQLGPLFVHLLQYAASSLPPRNVEARQIHVRSYLGPQGQALVDIKCARTPGLRAAVIRPEGQEDSSKIPLLATHNHGLALSFCHNVVSAFGGELELGATSDGASIRVILPPASSVRSTELAAAA